MDLFDNHILKEFYNFLRRRHALVAYKQNFIFTAIRNKSRSIQTPSTIMRQIDYRALVSWAFAWDEAQQGPDFWAEIGSDWDDAFIDIVKRIKSLQNGQ